MIPLYFQAPVLQKRGPFRPYTNRLELWRNREESMRVCLSVITWESIAAIATFIAVIVALIPIWRDARRKEAHAKSLRIRLCAKLTLFLPSLGNVVRRGQAEHPTAILSRDDFREVVRSIGAMMQESSVLQPEEQDRLGMAYANLEVASQLYDTSDFHAETAVNISKLIDEAISAMEKNGLLHNKQIETPWVDEEQIRPHS